jgi:putative DNA modification/repair radical SAM protein
MIDSLLNKLEILVDSAKYDASCASSGSRGNRSKTLGHGSRSGICHSWSADGRCISLLKILLSNACIYDCAYCVNRAGNDIPRATLMPAEVVELTVNFYRRNYIEGLFLSTGVIKSPDHTMEQLIEAIRLLREDSRFGGYIHLKLVPGADARLVTEACRYADRVSVNIELPSEQSLGLLAPQKGRASILQPMAQAGRLIADSRRERRKNRKAPTFAPAGQSTQLIVGATPENDRQILALSESLYQRMDLKRVYYSAFIPVSSDSRLPAIPEPPLLREHRLYQADWLLRFYGFTSDEILSAEQPDLDPQLDPKAGWALRNLHLFPVEVNRADYEILLRVPGIGVRSARRILRARRVGPLDFDGLKRLGVVLKRARFFLTANGRYLGEGDLAPARLRSQLLALPAPKKSRSQQLELFEATSGDAEHFAATVTGEL